MSKQRTMSDTPDYRTGVAGMLGIGTGLVLIILSSSAYSFLQAQDDSPDLAQKLMEQLRSDKAEERDQAVQGLSRIGPIIISKIKGALRSERDPEVRARLEYLLRSFVSRKICDGAYPALSPSGNQLACVRWVVDPGQFDLRGNQVWRQECWVRDLATNRETRIAEGVRAIRWQDEKSILLGSGKIVDAASGNPISEAAHPPKELRTKNQRWSPDARELVVVPDMMFYRSNPRLNAPVDVEGGLCWVDGKGDAKILDMGHSIDSDCNGFLSWSPDAKRVAFDLLFFRKGNVPRRRIGVVDWSTGKVTYVGESEYCHYNWGHNRNEHAGTAQDLWDATGDQFVFVTGRGQGEGEISISKADGTNVVRLTEDGQCKWCPVLDPASRRVAFAAAKWGGEDGTLLGGHLRVIDLLTGEEERFQPRTSGECSTLVWVSDGSRLFYDWFEGGASPSIYEAQFSPPRKMPAGSVIAGRPPGSRKDEILKAMGSENSAVVEWGIEAARDLKSPEVVAALRKTLVQNLQGDRSHLAYETLVTLEVLEAKEVTPEIFKALDAKDEWARCAAIRILARWKAKGAKERFIGLPKEYPDTRTAIHAAAALATLGHGDAWAELKRHAASKDKEIRGDLASILASVRDAHSVEILIGLVADRERLYWDYTGEVHVGDHAERSLATLTGETFQRDPVRWAAWWKERGGQLPELKGPNKGLEALRLEAERKGEENQQKFRERLK